MSLLVTGSVGIDTVRTPYGVNENCIGGSAVYFSMAAGFFTDVKFVGVTGDDCPFDLAELFQGKDVDLAGLEARPGSKTFRWTGSYEGDMNEARTDSVQLNVLAEQPPTVPESFRCSDYVFLANTAPSLQIKLLDQLASPAFVAADTMNHWIQTAGPDLKELLSQIDMLVLTDGEAKLLTGQNNLISAAKSILDMGPRFVVIKKGEHGVLIFSEGNFFASPAFLLEKVFDPTGAGDTFAGGFIGYLASCNKCTKQVLRRASVYGVIMSTFAVEDFSLGCLGKITRSDINKRLNKYLNYTKMG